MSVLIYDAWLPDNPIMFVSQEFTRQTGYQPGDALGRDCLFLQGPATDPVAAEELREAMRAERPVEVEILSYRRNGTPFWASLHIHPTYAENGRLTSFIGVQRVVARPVAATRQRELADA